MSEENIRQKALNLLKLSSAAFIDEYKRDANEKNAATRSKVYLDEYINLITAQEYVDSAKKSNEIHPTTLKASDLFKKRDCAGKYDLSCKNNEVTNENVKDFVKGIKRNGPSQKNEADIEFEEDFNNILDSIDSQENFDDSLETILRKHLDEKDSPKKAENVGLSFSDPFISSQSQAENQLKPRRSSEADNTLQNKRIGQKQIFVNTFKRPKLEDIVEKPKEEPKIASIFKMDKKKSPKVDKELASYELGIYKSYQEEKVIGTQSKAKSVNPWKQERMNKMPEVKEVRRESSFNQFNVIGNKNVPKENCISNKISEYVDKQHSKFNKNNEKEESMKKDDQKPNKDPLSAFRTGKQELEWQKLLQDKPPRRGLFKRDVKTTSNNEQIPNSDIDPLRKKFHCPSFPKINEGSSNNKKEENDEIIHEDLKGFDKELLKRIQREIVVDSKQVSWDDIIGLEAAKKIIKESVILAIRRPDLFSGLRETSRAIMLFGVPGTGKTLIGKCIASSCDATFMSVSASSLTSKWIGESETLVRAMFTYAKIKQPSVIFFDEIDSLLEKRSEQGNETFNRIKTEFLVQLDGANALKATDKVLLIGATNRPEVIDEAILRRFTKRILVPLPIKEARINMFKHLLSKHSHTLSDGKIDRLADFCDKYSGADIAQVCKEAAMMSIRRMDSSTLDSMKADDLPPITPKDFLKALHIVKPTVSQETITKLDEWNSKFGSIVDHNSTMDIDDTDFLNDDIDDL